MKLPQLTSIIICYLSYCWAGALAQPPAEPMPFNKYYHKSDNDSAKPFTPTGSHTKAYLANLQRSIKQAWLPPKGSESKTVVVVFKLHRGGELSNLRLDHSSGVATADQAALKAVENAAPFRQLPAEMADEIDIQFTFNGELLNGNAKNNAILRTTVPPVSLRYDDQAHLPMAPRKVRENANSFLRPMTFDEYRHAVDQVDFKKHTISLSRLKELCDKPGVDILDLRIKELYEQGHLKGALNLGPDVTKELLQQLVPDKKATIIIYCENNMMFPRRMISMTHVCLPQIITLGYPNTFELEGSFRDSDFGELWVYPHHEKSRIK